MNEDKPLLNEQGEKDEADQLMKDMPMIRLELDFLKQSMLHAFQGQLDSVNEQVRAAIEYKLSDEGLQDAIQRQVGEALEKRIGEEINRYFGWGDGAKAIEHVISEAFKNIKWSIDPR